MSAAGSGMLPNDASHRETGTNLEPIRSGNSKNQAPSTKQITRTKVPRPKPLRFGICVLVLVCDLGFGVWNFAWDLASTGAWHVLAPCIRDRSASARFP